MEYFYIILGIIIGWVSKIPFLLKWYRELQQTNDYREMKIQQVIKDYEARRKP